MLLDISNITNIFLSLLQDCCISEIIESTRGLRLCRQDTNNNILSGQYVKFCSLPA